MGMYCLTCTAIAHPEAANGMQLARSYEWAYWNDDGRVGRRGRQGNEIVFEDGDEPTDDRLTVDDVLHEGKSE